jgi:hypothetical protein
MEYTDDFKRKTIWSISKVSNKVHIAIRKDLKTHYESLTEEDALELTIELERVIDQIAKEQRG